jgi:hypothetical protein
VAAAPADAVLQVDAQPWATLLVTPLSSGIKVPQTRYTTPLSLQLPAGDYEVRFENDAFGEPQVVRVSLTPEQPTLLRVKMSGFDPRRAVDNILGLR